MADHQRRHAAVEEEQVDRVTQRVVAVQAPELLLVVRPGIHLERVVDLALRSRSVERGHGGRHPHDRLHRIRQFLDVYAGAVSQLGQDCSHDDCLLMRRCAKRAVMPLARRQRRLSRTFPGPQLTAAPERPIAVSHKPRNSGHASSPRHTTFHRILRRCRLANLLCTGLSIELTVWSRASGGITRISDIQGPAAGTGGRAGQQAQRAVLRSGRSGSAMLARGEEPCGQFGAGSHAELLEDVPDVGLHGVLRHEHRRGDLPVGLALCDQGGDAALGLGEPVSRRSRGDLGEFAVGLRGPQRRAEVLRRCRGPGRASRGPSAGACLAARSCP